MQDTPIEDKLDAALEQMHDRKRQDAANAAPELSGILAMAVLAQSMPKNSIPKPRRTYKFITTIRIPWQERLQRALRWSLIPITAVFVLVSGFQFSAAIADSLPGTTLYKIKLAAERTRVAVTTNPTDKANLELTYTQKRLTDVQTVMQKEDSSPSQQAAALNELKEQSQQAFAVVPQVAASNIIANQDDSLFKNLIAINNQQKDVLKTVPQEEAIAAITNTALQVTEDHQKTLATLLAAVNDKTLANLNGQSISITGMIALIDSDKQKVTVENNSFVITSTTTIKSGDATLKLSDLTPKTQVTIAGNKTKNGIIADRIEVLTLAAATPAKTGEVKGASTKTGSTTVATAKTNSETPPTNTDTATTTVANEPVTPDVDPNKVTGGYIIEPPDNTQP